MVEWELLEQWQHFFYAVKEQSSRVWLTVITFKAVLNLLPNNTLLPLHY